MARGPNMTVEQADAVVAKITAPRITEAGIAAKIARVSYIRLETTTVCTIQMINGFRFYGLSATISPASYNQEVGERYAYDDAFRQIWTHEAYLLRETLYLAASGTHDFSP